MSHSTDLIGDSHNTCTSCLYSGYIDCLDFVSLDPLVPTPLLGKDGSFDLLTLESTNSFDNHSKFRGWSDWETLANEPLHSTILSGMDRRPKARCSRSRGDAIISEYTLFGKLSFRWRYLSQLTIIQACHLK
jgi:hypothetical protein